MKTSFWLWMKRKINKLKVNFKGEIPLVWLARFTSFSWRNRTQFKLQRDFYILFIRNAIRHIWKWWGSREKPLLFIATDLRPRLPSVTSNHISYIIIPKPTLPSPWCTWQLGNGVQSGLPHWDVLNWATNTNKLPRKICLSLILIYISRGNGYPGTAVPVHR